MAEQRHSQSPPESQLWERPVSLSSPSPPPHTGPSLSPGLPLSPAGIVHTPLVVLLWGHLRMAPGKEWLQQHPAAGASPGGPVGIYLWAQRGGPARSLRSTQPAYPLGFCSCPHSLSHLLPLLTVQGWGRSPGSGQRGLRRQEWAASSAVGSRTPWRLRRSLLASPSKSPHSPATRPRNCGDSCTRTRVPAEGARVCEAGTRWPSTGPRAGRRRTGRVGRLSA